MSLAQQNGNETPDWLDVVKDQIRTALLEINTCMPGIIKGYDPATRTATVQPAIKRTTVEGEIVSRPLLEEVPVVFPYAGSQGITFPLNDGDPCLLIFSQRSIDDWVTLKLEGEVTDTRLHDINDAFCIPGPSSPLDLIPPKDGFQITHDKIWIGDKTSPPVPTVTGGPIPNIEIIQICAKLNELLALPLVSAMGPVTFDPIVATDIAFLKTALEALVP